MENSYGILKAFASYAVIAFASLSSKEAAAKPVYLSFIGLELPKNERISAINLRIDNAFIVAIPRLPGGWSISVKNDPEGRAEISGGALAGVAMLGLAEVKRFLKLDKSFDDKSPIRVSGSVTVSNGDDEQVIQLGSKNLDIEDDVSPP